MERIALRSPPPDRFLASDGVLKAIFGTHHGKRTVLGPKILGFNDGSVVLIGHNELIAHDDPLSNEEFFDAWHIVDALRRNVVPEPVVEKERQNLLQTIFFKHHGWASVLEPLRGLMGPGRTMLGIYTWGSGATLRDEWATGWMPQLLPLFERAPSKIFTLLLATSRVTPNVARLFDEQRKRIWH